MAGQHGEQRVVEQRGRDPQQARLVQLGGAGRPAELVVAVAPDQPADQDGQGEVGQHAPEQEVHVNSSAFR